MQIRGLQLLHPDDGAVIATIDQDDIVFSDRGKKMEDLLRNSGIYIPLNQQKHFDGHKIIKLNECDKSLFLKAFKQVYYPDTLKKSGFILEYPEGP